MRYNYIFEVSWEVCNKVGGIHTVISTKSISLSQHCDNLILIGPDVLRDDGHSEFIEDNTLFADWRQKIDGEGLHVRVGNWKIPGKPVAILINFAAFINDKDKIFSRFWEEYKLDSLSGQWDYIEPALFGYATGKVIESFVNYNTSVHDKIIAQFHEWMTGTGILYLKKHSPQIGTVFTTHATAVGRCIAGNHLPLYKNLAQYNGDMVARDFNITSKQSLEKTSAMNADVFTTVSDITALECSQLLRKDVDMVTPNGFEDDFVPEKDYDSKRNVARRHICQVAAALSGGDVHGEPLIVATAGRYEFTNKGYDLFIDVLGRLNKSTNNQKDIIALILVPGNNYGPSRAVQNILNHSGEPAEVECSMLTHNLHDAEFDPILNRLKTNDLCNRPHDRVKVVFVPAYLDGNDGIFNIHYYDLLPAVDITAFLSYYEPWGYTPLESIAFHIPTITTSLAGFGKWMQSKLEPNDMSVSVVERNEDNTNEVIDKTVALIEHFLTLDEHEVANIRTAARKLSEKVLWDNLITHYLKAYDLALNKVDDRYEKIINMPQVELHKQDYYPTAQNPLWRKIEITTTIPEKFKGLQEISFNLWWTWNYNAEQMFKYIDPKLWKKEKANTVTFFEKIPPARLLELESDVKFVDMYESVYHDFCQYMSVANDKQPPKIAYFSMEYGFNDNIKIFSGGLGILAGDYLKEAGDTNTDIVGLGLLYRYGYFKQKITAAGEQHAEYIAQDFDDMPILPVRDDNGSQKKIAIQFPGRAVYAKIWRVNVGRVPLFLLDTDSDENQEPDRYITSRLYGGDSEMRLKQEMILGIGGIRALEVMNIKPDIYHCNEGHAAFIGLERLRLLENKLNIKFDEALEIVRASTLFTTHTPVPAGHDVFDENLMRIYMAHYPARLKITWDEMMRLGRLNPTDKFSMSFLAANISQEINGVSMLHGRVSQDMFEKLWPGYFAEENHVGYVTNGVHYQTWTAKLWKQLHTRTFGANYLSDLSNKHYWEKIYNVDDSVIWNIRQKQRAKLISYVKSNVQATHIRRFTDLKYVSNVVENLSDDALTIGFARRFATYKRGDLLLRDIDRLSRILNNTDMPVQILFAGKAHPNDGAGQDLIREIVEVSKRPELLGKIVFIEDYDISLAKRMVQGVDIWLNTPTRLQEASGTSGMKAVMNGALHFSVLDGWWVEGYKDEAGWALPAEKVYQDQNFQDELDSQTIYHLLENTIIPLFYNRDDKNIPHDWIKYIKKSIAEIVPQFTTKRMIDDYKKHFYSKLYTRTQAMTANDYQMALDITKWKKNVKRAWNDVKILSAEFPDYEKQPMNVNENFVGKIKIDLSKLSPDDIGVEIVIVNNEAGLNKKIYGKYRAKLVKVDNHIAEYEITGAPAKPGFYNYAIRIFAQNEQLPYQQDSRLVMWG